jgi:hypothetical protein
MYILYTALQEHSMERQTILSLLDVCVRYELYSDYTRMCECDEVHVMDVQKS